MLQKSRHKVAGCPRSGCARAAGLQALLPRGGAGSAQKRSRQSYSSFPFPVYMLCRPLTSRAPATVLQQACANVCCATWMLPAALRRWSPAQQRGRSAACCDGLDGHSRKSQRHDLAGHSIAQAGVDGAGVGLRSGGREGRRTGSGGGRAAPPGGRAQHPARGLPLPGTRCTPDRTRRRPQQLRFPPAAALSHDTQPRRPGGYRGPAAPGTPLATQRRTWIAFCISSSLGQPAAHSAATLESMPAVLLCTAPHSAPGDDGCCRDTAGLLQPPGRAAVWVQAFFFGGGGGAAVQHQCAVGRATHQA